MASEETAHVTTDSVSPNSPNSRKTSIPFSISTSIHPKSPSTTPKYGSSRSGLLQYDDGEWLELGRLDGESDDEFVVRCCITISATKPMLRHVILLTSSQPLVKKAETKKV